MHRSTDAYPETTEADRTSQTRFGPRPVPEGHRPHRDGRGPIRRKGSAGGAGDWSSRAIIWGGVALGVAGLTAAAVLTTRALSDDAEHAPSARRPVVGRPTQAPRFARMNEREREEMRRRVQEQIREDSHEAARLRAQAQDTRSQGGMSRVAEVTQTANDLAEGLNNLARSLQGAFTTFRDVSQQAANILSDFAIATDQLKIILSRATRTDDPARDRRR